MIFSEKEEFEKLTATPAKAVKRWVKNKRTSSSAEVGKGRTYRSSWYRGTHEEQIGWVCWEFAGAGKSLNRLLPSSF